MYARQVEVVLGPQSLKFGVVSVLERCFYLFARYRGKFRKAVAEQHSHANIENEWFELHTRAWVGITAGIHQFRAMA